MMRLIAAEFRKLFTTRLWLWMLLAAAAWTAGYTALAIVFGSGRGGLTPPLSSAAGQHALFAIGAGGAGSPRPPRLRTRHAPGPGRSSAAPPAITGHP